MEVWAGDTESGSALVNLGDDVSFAGGSTGTEFYLHELMDGIAIFAPNDGTDIVIDAGQPDAISTTLNRDGFLLLAPADLPAALDVHHVTATQPIVIQTLGRANTFNDLGTWLGGVTARHRFGALGSYTLSVTAIDNTGQSTTDTTTVDVTQGTAPVADIDGPAVANEGVATGGGWSVDFDASGSTDDTGIIRYEWDFGDGNTGTGVTTNHIYTAPGHLRRHADGHGRRRPDRDHDVLDRGAGQ